MQSVSRLTAAATAGASLLALLLTAAPAAGAVIRVSHSLGGRANAAVGAAAVVEPFADIKSDFLTLPAGDDTTALDLSGQGSAIVTVGGATGAAQVNSAVSVKVGEVKALLTGSLSGVNDANNAGIGTLNASRAQASWEDKFFFNRDDLPAGFLISVESTLQFSGSLTAAVIGGPIGGFRGGRVQTSASIVPTGFLISGATGGVAVDNLEHTQTSNNFTAGEVNIVMTMINKQPTPFGVGLIVTGEGFASSQLLAAGSVTAALEADFSHTLTWGGIKAVRNAQTGELITDYTLTSESGFDYTRPFLPEPASAGLLALGLATLAVRRRR